jgi:hypothetical protein
MSSLPNVYLAIIPRTAFLNLLGILISAISAASSVSVIHIFGPPDFVWYEAATPSSELRAFFCIWQ